MHIEPAIKIPTKGTIIYSNLVLTAGNPTIKIKYNRISKPTIVRARRRPSFFSYLSDRRAASKASNTKTNFAKKLWIPGQAYFVQVGALSTLDMGRWLLNTPCILYGICSSFRI